MFDVQLPLFLRSPNPITESPVFTFIRGTWPLTQRADELNKTYTNLTSLSFRGCSNFQLFQHEIGPLLQSVLLLSFYSDSETDLVEPVVAESGYQFVNNQ